MNRSLLLAVALLCACGEQSQSTTGRPVRLQTAIAADAELDGPFLTGTGWTVELSGMALSVGALYYFDGEPAFAQRTRANPWQHVARLLLPARAHAHPGHYVAGMATGQMLEPVQVQLSAAPLALADASGVTGSYRSARFVLGRPKTADIELLANGVAAAEGVASKDGKRVHFRLRASFEDVARSVKQGQIDGCVFEEADVQRDGKVTVHVQPRVWFNLVDFEEVAEGTAALPTEIDAGQTPQVAFALGVVQLSAYRFRYQEGT